MNDFLDLKVGGRTKSVTVLEIKQVPNLGYHNKIQFICDSEEGHTFVIDEALTRDSKGLLICKGCWHTQDLHGGLNKDSAVAKILNYYKKQTLRELIGVKIKAYPKQNNYLAIVGCDFDEEKEIRW